MEGRALVTEALLTSAESTEVLGGLGNNVAEEVEVDGAGLHCGPFRQLEDDNGHLIIARLTLGRAGRATVGVDGGTLPLNLEPEGNWGQQRAQTDTKGGGGQGEGNRSKDQIPRHVKLCW